MKGTNDAVMPVLGHLGELRKRLIISIVAIGATVAVSFIFSNSILHALLLPLGQLHTKAFNVMDGFMIKWRISLYTGVVAAFPIWAYQAYQFIRPALYKKERNSIGPLILGSFILFIAGMAFAFCLLSSMISTLLRFFPPEIEFMPSANDYISFSTFFIMACGLVFQLPPVLVVLVQLRLVRAKTLRKQRRIAYFILFAFAEIITPVSDPIVAPLTVMCPLVFLYEISVFLAYRIERRRIKKESGVAAGLILESEASE
jgi:sec-independent protein translocase protein TatC